MEPSYPFEPLSIDSIKQSRWSLHQDLTVVPEPDLVESIKQFGLFHPPVVQKSEKDAELICGHIRLDLYKQFFGSKVLLCKVVPASVSTPDILKIVLEDQLLTGSLSPIMTARLMAMSNAELSKNDIAPFIAAAGLNPARCRHLLPLLKLEPQIRNAAHLGVISEKTALDFLSINSEDRIFLLDLIANLSLNSNKQKRLIEFCRIITGMSPQPIKNIFSGKLEQILDSEELDNVPQKSAALMKKLYELSHPFSTSAENEFNQKINSLKLPKNFFARHSPSFERDGLTLEIKLENYDQLEQRLEGLKGLFS